MEKPSLSFLRTFFLCGAEVEKHPIILFACVGEWKIHVQSRQTNFGNKKRRYLGSVKEHKLRLVWTNFKMASRSRLSLLVREQMPKLAICQEILLQLINSAGAMVSCGFIGTTTTCCICPCTRRVHIAFYEAATCRWDRIWLAINMLCNKKVMYNVYITKESYLLLN